MSDTKITTINIKMGEQEVSLSIEQAKELQSLLNETFPEPKETIKYIPGPVIERIIERKPYRYWYPCWGTTTLGTTYSNDTTVTFSLSQ